jgi:hypothetical protein
LRQAAAALLALATLATACAESTAPAPSALAPQSTSPSASVVGARGSGVPVALLSRVGTNLCLDVWGATGESGSKVVSWGCHGGANQSFAWESTGEIKYAGKCLDAWGALGRDGDAVVLWPCNGGANQRWTGTAAGEIRGINDKCLDVWGATSTPGAPIVIWECHGGPNQQWDDPASGSTPAPAPAVDTVRVVTFGDSNLDLGYSGTDATIRVRAYVSNSSSNRLGDWQANSPLQVSGKVEQLWRSGGGLPIRAVNHAIWGTGTGGGGNGGPERSYEGAPNARTVVDGVTRFEAEVLGRGSVWSGGESYGAIGRTQSFRPTANSYAIIVLGSNDAYFGMSAGQTASNLTWMVGQWTGAGLRADHLVLTTVSPRTDNAGGEPIARINDEIRAIAGRTGTGLIDVANHTSADNGRTWRGSAYRVDGAHWSESVRDWLAQELVSYMRARTR